MFYKIKKERLKKNCESFNCVKSKLPHGGGDWRMSGGLKYWMADCKMRGNEWWNVNRIELKLSDCIRTGMNNKMSKQESECGMSKGRRYFITGMSKRGKGMIEIWVATVSCEGWLAITGSAPAWYGKLSRFKSKHSSKIINVRHKQRSGQHTVTY